MIKVKKSDTLAKIMKKIDDSKTIEVFLEFPIGHGLLSDFSGLNILKKRFKNKKLVFITKDLRAKKLLKKLNFRFTIIKDENYLKNNLDNKTNLIKQNTSFFEYFVFEIKNNYFKLKNKIIKKGECNSKKTNSNLPILIISITLLLSSFLLIFIFYFAVHRTYIYITPEIDIIKKQKNFTFKDSTEISLNSNVIKLKKIKSNAVLIDDFSATSIEYETSKQSIGKVTLFNELNFEQGLIKNTRLINDDGIIYRLKNRIEVPAASIDIDGNKILGTIDVTVEADPFDLEGYFVGKRGNKENEVLSIPGLTGELKNRIYGKSQVIKGGEDKHVVIIGEDDLENSTNILKEKLKNIAIKQIEQKIKDENKINLENYTLLLIGDNINYTDFEVENLNNIKIGDKTKQFKLKGTINISAYAFNKDIILTKLKNEINKKIIKGQQKIVFIDKQSLRVAHVVWNNKNNNSVKATMEIEAGVSNDFGSTSNFYTDDLKSKIIGIINTDAYDILLNMTNINNVEIENSPFFMNKITPKKDNIFFKIKNN